MGRRSEEIKFSGIFQAVHETYIGLLRATLRRRRSEFRCKVGTETRTFGISKEEMHGEELLWVHNPVLHMLITWICCNFFFFHTFFPYPTYYINFLECFWSLRR
jgi:hypothetical protein